MDELKTVSQNDLLIEDAPQIVWVRVQDAYERLLPGNPKIHNLDAVVASIRQHGMQELPKFDSNVGIKAGNGRVEALHAMEQQGGRPPRGIAQNKQGEWVMPLLVGVDAKSREAALAYAVDSNNIGLMHEGGFSSLETAKHLYRPEDYAIFLRSIPVESMPVSVPMAEIGDILAALDKETGEGPPRSNVEARIDEAEELRAAWGVESGQLWRLQSRYKPDAPHFVMCADSRNPGALQRLSDGRMFEAMWTDPPYGVEYDGLGTRAPITGDEADELEALLSDVFRNIDPLLKPGAPFYVAHAAGANSYIFAKVILKVVGWHYHQQLVWVKQSIVMGRSDYHYQHEPIIYGWKLGAAHPWYGGRKTSSVFNIDRPSKNKLMSVMKPIALIEAHLEGSTRVHDRIVEPFGGSGSTLIACENTGRACSLIEIEPALVAVILQRYQDAYDIKPQLLPNDQRPFDNIPEASEAEQLEIA